MVFAYQWHVYEHVHVASYDSHLISVTWINFLEQVSFCIIEVYVVGYMYVKKHDSYERFALF